MFFSVFLSVVFSRDCDETSLKDMFCVIGRSFYLVMVLVKFFCGKCVRFRCDSSCLGLVL